MGEWRRESELAGPDVAVGARRMAGTG